MRRAVSFGMMIAVSVGLTACATRGYVRETVNQKGTEIDRRVGVVDTRVSEGATRVEGMGYKLTTLEGSVQRVGETAQGAATRAEAAHGRADVAHGRADQAHARADQAHGRADEVDSRLTRLWSNRFNRDVAETVHVQFAFNSADLTDSAQTALVSIVRELQNNPGLAVNLEGYTDVSGDRGYNVQLAQRRVEAVRRYLVQAGIDQPRVNAIGLGPLGDRAVPEKQKRRVTVKFMVPKD